MRYPIVAVAVAVAVSSLAEGPSSAEREAAAGNELG
jgi:hypothetical protein